MARNLLGRTVIYHAETGADYVALVTQQLHHSVNLRCFTYDAGHDFSIGMVLEGKGPKRYEVILEERKENSMRQVTDHVVEGDAVNHQLAIEVLDGPEAGGANHSYRVAYQGERLARLEFQNGPIKEAGVNGITHEALLAVVIDRLRGFQAGPFPRRENAIALTHVEEALMWLQKRTRERLKRGVEGTTAA